MSGVLKHIRESIKEDYFFISDIRNQGGVVLKFSKGDDANLLEWPKTQESFDGFRALGIQDAPVCDAPSIVKQAILCPDKKYDFDSMPNGFKASFLLNYSVRYSVPLDSEDISFIKTHREAVIENSKITGSIHYGIDKYFTAFSNKKEYVDLDRTIFSTFSPLIESSLKAKVRVKLVEFFGDSRFIAEEFGITNFFTIKDFENLISKKIREEIEKGASTGAEYVFEELYNSGGLDYEDEDEAEYPINHRNLLRLTAVGKGREINDFSNKSDLTITEDKAGTVLFRELDERAGILGNPNVGTISIPYEKLLNSTLYDNPIKYDFIAPYDSEQLASYRESGTKKQDIYPDRLKKFYDPINYENYEKFFKWWSGSDAGNTTGIDEIILGSYLAFITDLEEEVQKEGKIDENIASSFDESAHRIYPYIMNWLVVHFENHVRYNLAKVVAELSADKLKEIDAAEGVVAAAEDEANLNLENLQGDLLEDEITKEQISERVKLYKQCALLMNMHKLKEEHNKISIHRRTKTNEEGESEPSEMHTNGYYNNRFYMIGDPEDQLSVKNKLISPSGKTIKPFLEITPDIASALRPRLRLFKVYQVPDEGSTKTVSFEFPFPTYSNKDRIDSFNGQDIDRGDGVGIKSFNFSFDGETPATSQKYISADLTLFFQSFQDFVKERRAFNARSDEEDEYFRYVDLFVNTSYCPRDASKSSILNYDPSHYRLRVDVGWEPRRDKGFAEILKKRDINLLDFNKALEKMNKSFYLNLIDHEINISDTGTVTITANYMAYIEGVLQSNNALLSRDAKKLQDKAVIDYEKVLNEDCNSLELRELRETINAIRVKSRDMLHQSIIEKLILNKCLYSVEIENKSRSDFSRQNYFSDTPKLITKDNMKKDDVSIFSGTSEDLLKKLATSTTKSKKWNYIVGEYLSNPKQGENKRINFFFLSDVVYFILDSLYESDDPYSEREEQIKVILSSFSVNIPFVGHTELNLGQIPIEIETFSNWYTEQIIDKEIDFISFLDFIKRLALFLITDIFHNICIDEEKTETLSFMTSAINSIKLEGSRKKVGGMESILYATESEVGPVLNINDYYNTGDEDFDDLPLSTSSKDVVGLQPADFVQYLLVYPHYKPETNKGRGLAVEDAKRGVHHLYIGSDRGILKNVSFSKSDIQFIREARMMAQGQSTLLQLSSLYRANIKMIGNTIFYPGMLLYLNPFGFGGMDFGLPHQGPGDLENPNLSNIMGIGGYQKIVKVSSTIDASGKFETDVECIFEHTGQGPQNTSSRSPASKDQQRIACSDLISENIDEKSIECRASDLSKDLQNKLLGMGNGGKIDDK